MSPRNERIAAAVFAALVIVYAVVLFTHTCEVAGGSDSSGYANEARAIGRGQMEERVAEMDRFGFPDSFTPGFAALGYTAARQPRFVTPSYPPGLPMHMALAGWLFGWKHAPFYVIPLSAVAGVILLALFARRLFGSWWIAAGAAFSLGLCATYIYMGMQPMSDTLVTAWSIGAIAAAWRARDQWGAGPTELWAAIAGASAAVSVWIRPSNALLGLALLFALPWTKKAIAWCIAAGAIVTVPLLAWNARWYGGAFRTGYGDLGGLVEWKNFPSHSIHYLWWTAALLTPLVWAGAVYSLIRARRERIHLVLALWFWPFYIFYAFYGPYDTWWYTRFLLPSYPALILGTVYAARAIGPRAIAVACALMIAAGIAFSNHFDVFLVAEAEATYPNVVRWAETELPGDAFVIAAQFSGARRYYKHRFSFRYDFLDPEKLKILEETVPPDRWYMIVSEWDLAEALRRTGGRWTTIGQYREVSLLHRDPNGALSSNDVKGDSR